MCKELKTMTDFPQRKSATDGKASYCKSCKSRIGYDYNGTVPGLIVDMYSAQKKSSKRRNMNPPSYSKEELTTWLTSQVDFQPMYDKWLTSERDASLRPSIDRIDDYIGYSLSNIQLMTWGENNLKGYHDRSVGKNNKVSKRVVQLDLLGNYIQEFHSIAEAKRVTRIDGTHIANVAKGKSNTAGGFKWKFPDK